MKIGDILCQRNFMILTKKKKFHDILLFDFINVNASNLIYFLAQCKRPMSEI